MPKSRNRKNHKAKVEVRKKRLKDVENRFKKYQQKVFDDLVKQHENKQQKSEDEIIEEIDTKIEGVDAPEL